MAGKKSGMQVSVSAEDWKKSQGSGVTSNQNSSGINVSVSAEDWKKSGSPKRYDGYNWEIDSFAQDANNFFRMAQRDNSGEKRFNAADYFEERKKQADALKQMGCDIIQGYYFSRPLPAQEFVNYVRERQTTSPGV
jgi:hypothetical protein